VVYKAKETSTGKHFAIKRIQKDEEGVDIELLKREIYIMKKVDHPNILKLYEVYEDDDHFFLVLELYVTEGGVGFFFIIINCFFFQLLGLIQGRRTGVI
jgi:hypothetical protein